MTDKDLFTTYKKTAPAADLGFFLAHAPYLSGDQKIALKALQDAKLARAEFYRRLTTVQNAWRRMRNDQDREAGILTLNSTRAFDEARPISVHGVAYFQETEAAA